MTEVFERENRRAEVDGVIVSFFRLTGERRRSKAPCWWKVCVSPRHAEWLAERWAYRGKMGKLAI